MEDITREITYFSTQMQFSTCVHVLEVTLTSLKDPTVKANAQWQQKKKLSDVEIESDDDYELDEIEEHELDVSLYLAQIIQYSFHIRIWFLILYFLQRRLNQNNSKRRLMLSRRSVRCWNLKQRNLQLLMLLTLKVRIPSNRELR